jgi:hypothetical protein
MKRDWLYKESYPDILPKDSLPTDILPNGHFAERTLAENRYVISSKCLGL